MNPFENCPIYETKNFELRKLQKDDINELFLCYSDAKAAKFFNSDCCENDFYYTDITEFEACVDYWMSRYEAEDFVRWSIFDKKETVLIGTVELCPSMKYSVDGKMMGILRIDLQSEYEKQAILEELMDILIEHVYEDFQVASLLMKIQREAVERKKMIPQYCFVRAMDECNITFTDYYVRFN